MEQIIYRCFKTLKNHYIYDRHTNTIFPVTESEYMVFEDYLHGKYNDKTQKVFEKYQQFGLLRENQVTKIEHPSFRWVEHYAEHRVESLTLQVTQQCNLRCSYCAYSGLYYNREHSSERMSIETAISAIDFLLAHSDEIKEIHIGFYGGEPLLEFDLIKTCVSYVKEKVEGKIVTFGITTNGTLLTEEVVSYMVENDFQLSVSLDGSKTEHDSNRKFRSGKGSFDLIMKNLKYVKEHYPDFMARTSIMTVVSPNANIADNLQFFNTDQVLADSNIMMNPLAETGLKEEVQYKDSFNLIRRYEYLKYLLFATSKLARDYVSDLVISSHSKIQEFYQSLHRLEVYSGTSHHGGPCIPGVKRLFVTVNGELFPCEKVSETAPCNCIGSLEEGFDIKKMQTMLNLGKLTEAECITCWNLPNCKICAGQIEVLDGCTCFCKEDKLKACQEEKMSVMAGIYEMAVLREFHFHVEEREASI